MFAPAADALATDPVGRTLLAATLTDLAHNMDLIPLSAYLPHARTLSLHRPESVPCRVTTQRSHPLQVLEGARHAAPVWCSAVFDLGGPVMPVSAYPRQAMPVPLPLAALSMGFARIGYRTKEALQENHSWRGAAVRTFCEVIDWLLFHYFVKLSVDCLPVSLLSTKKGELVTVSFSGLAIR